MSRRDSLHGPEVVLSRNQPSPRGDAPACRCRVLLCNRWLYMETRAFRRLLGPLAWYIPHWLIRRIVRRSTHAQGTSRHAPGDVQHVGRLDLKALRLFLGACCVVPGGSGSVC